MLIKVCGMRSEKQVNAIHASVDFVGFIFYEHSKRYVVSTPMVEKALKVGVFVNESTEVISNRIQEHSLDLVQLHGSESSEMCEVLKQESKIIKAFGVDEDFDFNKTKNYEEHADYFLFDTKTKFHGGSGRQFDWSVLSNYEGEVPFILSGGINPSSIQALKKFHHPKLVGIDLNSGFEHAPADKNLPELNLFIKELKK